MDIIQKNNLNIEKIFKQSVCESKDFHLFADELDINGSMPTFTGLRDEIYSFDEMNNEFFEFLNRKADENGIYIRLVYASQIEFNDYEAVFQLEYSNKKEIFKTNDISSVEDVEFSDYGIKIWKNEITIGTTVEGDFNQTPYFSTFTGKDVFLSLDNPLNKRVIEIIEEILKK